MIVKSEKTLERFRSTALCEFCGLWLPRREPHHIIGRGSGGGSRLDIPDALAGLCPTFKGNDCHQKHGNDPKFRPVFLEIVAARMNWPNGYELQAYLWWVLALPKLSDYSRAAYEAVIS